MSVVDLWHEDSFPEELTYFQFMEFMEFQFPPQKFCDLTLFGISLPNLQAGDSVALPSELEHSTKVFTDKKGLHGQHA